MAQKGSFVQTGIKAKSPKARRRLKKVFLARYRRFRNRILRKYYAALRWYKSYRARVIRHYWKVVRYLYRLYKRRRISRRRYW
jgi:hypothetical protein